MSLQFRQIYRYRKTFNIRRTILGNKIVDHSDIVGASPVGAAPATSLFVSNTWLQWIQQRQLQDETKKWDFVRLVLEIWRYILFATNLHLEMDMDKDHSCGFNNARIYRVMYGMEWSNEGYKHQNDPRLSAWTVRHKSIKIILFLIRHEKPINDSQKDDFHIPMTCLSWSVNQPSITHTCHAVSVSFTLNLSFQWFIVIVFDWPSITSYKNGRPGLSQCRDTYIGLIT